MSGKLSRGGSGSGPVNPHLAARNQGATPESEAGPASFEQYIDAAKAAGGAEVDRRCGDLRRGDRGAAQLNSSEMETGTERRRGVGRRRSDWARAAEEGEMTQEQFLFIKAIDAFKRGNGVMYPTWTDVLEVVRLLGYRKTAASELSIAGAEDWIEGADVLSGVRAKPGHPERRRKVA